MLQDQGCFKIGRDGSRPDPVAASFDVESPPPLPPDMVDNQTGTLGNHNAGVSPLCHLPSKWSLSLPTRADLSDRTHLGQVILGIVCFCAYATCVLGLGQGLAAHLIAHPLLLGITIPLLAALFVRLFRAQAFGRGFVLGIALTVLYWIAFGVYHAFSAGT